MISKSRLFHSTLDEQILYQCFQRGTFCPKQCKGKLGKAALSAPLWIAHVGKKAGRGSVALSRLA